MDTLGVKTRSLKFPHLRVLRFTDYTWSSVVYFLLTHIVAPNLTTADFSGVYTRRGDKSAVDAYIPETFLSERSRMTRLSVFWWRRCQGFIATFGSADSNNSLIIHENADVSGSVLNTSPVLDCLRNIEHACLDFDDHVPDVLWLVECLQNAKSLVVRDPSLGLCLLQSKDPVFVPGLVSLTLDVSGCKSDLIGSIAGILQDRAKIAGPVPLLRLRVGTYAPELIKELEGYANEIKKHVGTLEIMQRESMWPAWFNRHMCPGDHGYWDDRESGNLISLY
ncbi:hypothetical protein L226DRAFT_214663 [Lentinus tigrinus ALCF2SS1-7]|uniref:Uncharacterized protein n=1 Tax=Lentinus tigrinus ALCF2SS1-6 TaxID=1328759 RepID=A0A5C2RZ96_9APHY|nr:hypothetical protein L227DRAFT_656355 [Lentinus tigrinus ALCF2SS1-6]RPD71071.1 hypothetical protein L226DRAFT_214663 [Lentinus tigrinus ALCF2SS1-7]